MASQDPNIAVSAYGTPPNNIIYGTLFDKSEHIPKMVIHVLYPVGVSKRPGYKDIKGVSWKKDKQLVDLNGKICNRYFYLFVRLIAHYSANLHIKPCLDMIKIRLPLSNNLHLL